MPVSVFPKVQKQGVNEMNDYVFLSVISGAQKQGVKRLCFGQPEIHSLFIYNTDLNDEIAKCISGCQKYGR
jgi:hypothetical protein